MPSRPRWGAGGERLVTHGTDGRARLWDPAQGALLAEFGAADSESCLSFALDGSRLALQPSQGPAETYDVGRLPAKRLFTLPYAARRLAFTPDATLLLVVPLEGDARLVDVRNGAERQRLEGLSGETIEPAFEPGGMHMLAKAEGKGVGVWDLASGHRLVGLPGPAGSIFWCNWPAPGARVLMGGLALGTWDATTGAASARFAGHEREALLAVLRDDARSAVSARRDGTVREWDLTSTPEHDLLTAPHRVLSVAFHPGGAHLLAACVAGSRPPLGVVHAL